MKSVNPEFPVKSPVRWFLVICFGVSVSCLSCILITCVSCGKVAGKKTSSDFYVNLKNAQGLSAGASVQWRGMEIGRVGSVEMDDGTVCVDVQLFKEYKGKLREGVRASPGNGFLGRSPTTLELYGGDDSTRKFLNHGAKVAEAGFVDSMPAAHKKILLWVVGVLAILLLVFFIIRKIIVFLLVFAFLTFAGLFFYKQWQKYGADIEAVRYEMQINQVAKNMLSDEAAQDAWKAVQSDLTGVFGEFAEKDNECVQIVTADLCENLKCRADELTRDGKEEASREIKELLAKLKKELELEQVDEVSN